MAFDVRLVIQLVMIGIMGLGIIMSNISVIEGHVADGDKHIRMNENGLPLYPTRSEFEEFKKMVNQNNKLLIAIAAKQGIQIQGIYNE